MKSTSKRGQAAKPDLGELLAQAIGFQQAGRDAEAEAIYQSVLAREPRQPGANHLLGLIRLKQGRAGEAVEYIARSVKEKPRDAQYLSNLGVALRSAGRLAEAIEVLARAVAANPDMAEAHANLGITLRSAGQFNEAITSLRTAVRLKPAEAGFHFNLANSLFDAGYVLECRQSFAQAIQLRPGFTMASVGLVRSLTQNGASEEALHVVDTALAGRPNDAHLHLWRGRCLQLLGRLAEAEEPFRRAIALDPRLGEAHLRLSYLSRDHDEASVAALERMFSDATAPVDQRVFAGFALGKALRDGDRHVESIASFRAANALNRQQFEFDVNRAVSMIEEEARWFEVLAAAHSRPSPEKTRYVFVVGMPRTGKTTIEGILGLHPDVVAAGELPTLGRLFSRVQQQAHPENITSEQLARVADEYRADLGALGLGGRVVVDTMPSNVRRVSLISLAFPDARIVWTTRGMPDLALAMFEKHFTGGGFEYTYDFAELGAYLDAYHGLRRSWLSRNSGAALDIDVSMLRSGGPQAVRNLIAACGLAWTDSCLEYQESEPELGDWPADRLARNRADHLAAWRAEHPQLWSAKSL